VRPTSGQDALLLVAVDDDVDDVVGGCRRKRGDESRAELSLFTQSDFIQIQKRKKWVEQKQKDINLPERCLERRRASCISAARIIVRCCWQCCWWVLKKKGRRVTCRVLTFHSVRLPFFEIEKRKPRRE
jgi:hypothetical protein